MQIYGRIHFEDSQSSLHDPNVVTDDHHLTHLDTEEHMETEKMDIQFEHETSEECETSLLTRQ